MNTTGFIKLPRSLLDWRWYGDLNTRSLYLHLLLTAEWEDTCYMNRVIKRGQCCTTLKELATSNHQSIQQVRTALNHLVSTNEITIETTPKYSMITLTRYDLFSQYNKPPDIQTANGQHEVRHEIPTNSNKPTIKEEKKKIRKEEAEEENLLLRRLQSAVSEYNSICTSMLPVTGELSYHQAQLIRQAEKELHGTTFREYFTRAEASDFLAGRTGKFKATFGWLIRPENIARVLSGKYDGTYSVPVRGSGEPEKKKRDYTASIW